MNETGTILLLAILIIGFMTSTYTKQRWNAFMQVVTGKPTAITPAEITITNGDSAGGGGGGHPVYSAQ